MRSRTTAGFRAAFARLPDHVQKQARKAYRLFLDEPGHPSLSFKRVHTRQLIYSVRVSFDYRALGVREADTVIWFWIGSHSDYEKTLGRR